MHREPEIQNLTTLSWPSPVIEKKIAVQINGKPAPAVGKIAIGDLIVSVNGVATKGKRHQLVHDVCNSVKVGDNVRFVL